MPLSRMWPALRVLALAIAFGAMGLGFLRRLDYCSLRVDHHGAKVSGYSARDDATSRAAAAVWLGYHVQMGRKYRRAAWLFMLPVPPDPPEPPSPPSST